MSVQYEVINLETKEVVPASIATIGNVTDEYTEVSFVENGEEKTVRFSNIENEGNLLHEQYAIREVGTQLTPNVDGVVTDEGDRKSVV